MNRRGIATVVLVLLICAGGAGAQGQPAPRPAERVAIVKMEDQFGRPHDAARLRGNVVVLIYGDRKSADANRELGEKLHVLFHSSARGQPPARARLAPVKPVPGQQAGTRPPEVHAIPVACVGAVPAVVQRLLSAQMRSASPDVPVWLDFEDAMKQQFPFAAGVPNVAVLDAHGRYRYRASGALQPEQFNQFVGVIEALRMEAIQGR
jgi:hypothetical protein